MPKYIIRWEESHKIIIEGKNKKDAIEQFKKGFGSDESAEKISEYEIIEINI